MTVKRITRITFEANETFAIRRWRSAFEGSCAVCGSRLGEVTPEEAAWLLRIKIADVDGAVEAGSLHVLQGDSGARRVCLGSVERAAQLFLPGAKLQINHLEENSQ